jgi:hypothetical protein
LSLEDTQSVIDNLGRWKGVDFNTVRLSCDLEFDDIVESSAFVAADHAEMMDDDLRHYAFGRLMAENHPYLDMPCCTLHVCMLAPRMSSMMSGQPPELYMVNWWALMGPSLGMRLSEEEYRALVDAVLENKTC